MFTHLHVHSNYSLLYGTHHISELVISARRMGYKSIALTDINNIYGLHTFLDVCHQENMVPIIGSEIQYNDKRAVILVKDKTGYSNLTRLITSRMRNRDFDFPAQLIKRNSGNIILTDSKDLLKQLCTRVSDLFAMINRPNRDMYNLAKSLNIPAAATCDAVFLHRSDVKVHRVLRAIANLTTISRLPDKELAPSDAFLDNHEQIQSRFELYPDAVKNTELIAAKCNFRKIFDGLIFPKYNTDKKSNGEVLREMAVIGAEKRYGELSDSVMQRMEYELDIIREKGFESYFLVVADIVSKASRICGRGSGAASILSYTLGISDVDPLRHNLYFERFLNPEREDPPDIDVDFPWDERDDIIDNVMQSYNRNNCAMVCNHNHFKPRSAIRETARCYGIPESEIKAMEKQILTGFSYYMPQKIKSVDDRSIEMQIESPWDEIMMIAKQISGFPRHLGVHVGGIVITPEHIDSYVPIETATKGVPVITWEKDGAEDAGLVKIDLLGNRSLAVVRDALCNLAENNIHIDEYNWNPIDDIKTQELLASGNTMGIFYVESPAMRQLQKKTNAGDFEHIVIHTSIIRPAANKFIKEYVERLKGKDYDPLHPYLEKILDETYGIMCYQEDVSKTAVALAGFSSGEADGLRRILSKKNKQQKLLEYKNLFYAGAIQRGVDTTCIDKIWEMIESFEGYSFCKPHSASFSMLSFKSAFIKAHYPAEFMAAVISNLGGYYSTQAYISEARRMGITILGPDVNKSRYKCYADKGIIRIGFMFITAMNRNIAHAIIKERDKNGLYRSLSSFLDRNRIAPSDAEALIKAGTLDSLANGINRNQMLWELLIRYKNKSNNDTQNLFETGQQNLFSGCSPSHPKVSAPGKMTMLRQQYNQLGFLYDYHPLIFFRDKIRSYDTIKARDLKKYTGKLVSLIGWPITYKTILTKEGQPMEFHSFEDETAIYETVLFPKAYMKYNNVLESQQPFLITGFVDDDMGAVSVHVKRVSRI